MTKREEIGCTIIIPLYNKKSSIARAIDSVISQTFRSWKLIIVDDGSTDASTTVVREYLHDSRIELISQENRGPGAARNLGLARTKSQNIAFLDADDEWAPAFLESLIDVLDQNPRASLAVSSWRYGEHEVDSTVKRRSLGIEQGEWQLRRERTHTFGELKGRVDSIHSSAVVARTEHVRGLYGFYENRATYGEDAFLWGQFVFSGKVIVYLDDQLLKFHTDESSLSFGRGTSYPVPPVILDSALFVASLNSWQKRVALKYLSNYASYVARRAISQRAPFVFLFALLNKAKIKFSYILMAGNTND